MMIRRLIRVIIIPLIVINIKTFILLPPLPLGSRQGDVSMRKHMAHFTTPRSWVMSLFSQTLRPLQRIRWISMLHYFYSRGKWISSVGNLEVKLRGGGVISRLGGCTLNFLRLTVRVKSSKIRKLIAFCLIWMDHNCWIFVPLIFEAILIYRKLRIIRLNELLSLKKMDIWI